MESNKFNAFSGRRLYRIKTVTRCTGTAEIANEKSATLCY